MTGIVVRVLANSLKSIMNIQAPQAETPLGSRLFGIAAFHCADFDTRTLFQIIPSRLIHRRSERGTTSSEPHQTVRRPGGICLTCCFPWSIIFNGLVCYSKNSTTCSSILYHRPCGAESPVSHYQSSQGNIALQPDGSPWSKRTNPRPDSKVGLSQMVAPVEERLVQVPVRVHRSHWGHPVPNFTGLHRTSSWSLFVP